MTNLDPREEKEKDREMKKRKTLYEGNLVKYVLMNGKIENVSRVEVFLKMIQVFVVFLKFSLYISKYTPIKKFKTITC